MPENVDGADLYELQELAGLLGIPVGRARGFADKQAIREYLGAVTVRGKKGARYPEAAVERFRRIIEAQDSGLVTPATAEAWVRRFGGAVAPAEGQIAPENAEALAVVRAVGLTDLADLNGRGPLPPGAQQVVCAMRELTEALRVSAPLDRAHTLKAAHEATGLSMKTIRDQVPHVVEGGRRRWMESDLKAFMAQQQRRTAPPRRAAGAERTEGER
jgi:hypothetical protein